MQRLEKLDLGILSLLVVAIVICLPLGQSIELGSDEGFELVKGFLQLQGFHLYSQIWSDQPPFFTFCLSTLFEISGPSLLAARLLAAGFCLILLLALFVVVFRKSGRVAAWTSVLLLLSTPIILRLGVSVMQEVPAFALGMASVWVLSRQLGNHKWRSLIISSALMAGALMIKFTAGLLIPAIIGEFFFVSDLTRAKLMNAVRVSVCWGAAVIAFVTILGALFGFGSFAMLVGAHVRVEVIPGMSRPSDFSFPLQLLVDHWEAYLGVLVALIIVIGKNLWREAVFPVILLATVTVVHWMHRPWWYCYYLHHAIPVAWLCGIAVREIALELRRAFGRANGFSLRNVFAGMFLTLLIVKSGLRLSAEISAIRSSKRVSEDVMLTHVRKYRTQTRWLYAQPIIYAFHARLLVPPELAVVARKRYWSGQMTWQELLVTIKKYRPEQLLLFKSKMGPEWIEFLKEGYVLDYEEGDKMLYVSKSVSQNL